MAVIVGVSGAWKDVQRQLSMSNVSAQTTLEVKQKLNELEQQRQWQHQAMEQEFINKVHTLSQDIQQKQSSLQPQINALQSQTQQQIQKLDIEIIEYKSNVDSQLSDIEQRIEAEQQRLSEYEKLHQSQIDQAITELSNQYENDSFDLNSQKYHIDTKFHSQLSALRQEKISTQNQPEQVPEELQIINQNILLLENEKVALAKQGWAVQLHYWLLILLKWQWSSSYSSQLSRLSQERNQYVEQVSQQHKQAMEKINTKIDETQKIYNAELEKIEAEKRLLAHTYQQTKTQTQRKIEVQQRQLFHSLKQDKIDLLKNYEIAYQTSERQKIELKQQEQSTIADWHHSLKTTQEQYESLQVNRDNFIQQGCDQFTQKIENLHHITSSKSFIGAEAELAVIEHLSHLPNQYYILNDVHLQLHRYTKCFDNRIISAQIDHLVIAPTGVFLIETKNWSQKFAQSGHYYNPYQQAHCAAWLCRCYLREVLGIQVKVRSIVAYWGALPPKDKKYFSVPKQIEAVKGYIQYFKEPALNKYQVEQIVSKLNPSPQYQADSYLGFH